MENLKKCVIPDCECAPPKGVKLVYIGKRGLNFLVRTNKERGDFLSWVYVWIRMTHADKRRGRTYDTFVHCLAFAEAANRPYRNVLYANSLWSTNSRWIAFGYSPNIRRTVECCLPRLGNTSTLYVGFIFACRICVLFAFRCKPGFKTRRCSTNSQTFLRKLHICKKCSLLYSL